MHIIFEALNDLNLRQSMPQMTQNVKRFKSGYDYTPIQMIQIPINVLLLLNFIFYSYIKILRLIVVKGFHFLISSPLSIRREKTYRQIGKGRRPDNQGDHIHQVQTTNTEIPNSSL